MGKTESVMFGSKRKLKKVKYLKILCNGHTTEPSKYVKYLALIIVYQGKVLQTVIKREFIVSKVNSRLFV